MESDTWISERIDGFALSARSTRWTQRYALVSAVSGAQASRRLSTHRRRR